VKVQILAKLCFERYETPTTSELDIRSKATRQSKRSLVIIRPRDATDDPSGLREPKLKPSRALVRETYRVIDGLTLHGHLSQID
jgi:hypothetical protein